MPVINTNVNAIIARNAGAVNDRSMTNAMQQLSTGKRINVAADDAAGLAISTKMTSQIRGLDQAVRNANDGIAMLQVVEGATVEMTNMLQRMRELAVQSANDTNTSAERSYLDDEFQQLRQEIDRIANTTQWNGVNVMDGSQGNIGAAASTTTGIGGNTVKFQVGANANQTIDFQIGDFNTQGAATSDVETAAFADGAISSISISGVSVSFTSFTASAGNDTYADWESRAATIQAAIDQSDLSGYVTVEAIGVNSSATVPVLKFTDIRGDDLSGTATTGITWGSTQTGATTGTAGVFGSSDLNNADITSLANANTAVTSVSNALTYLNEQRSAIGATINRLNYASDNLTNISANVNSARSRVLDTDYAKATTELARTQIIQQASTAMLAQANQGAQSVLSLLK